MGTTPRYALPYPEAADLVAQLPTTVRDLAETVEATITDRFKAGRASVAVVTDATVTTSVVFDTPFLDVPVVTATATSARAGDHPRYVTIENVTALGFDARVWTVEARDPAGTFPPFSITVVHWQAVLP